MKVIDYTFENLDGFEITVKVEYAILPYSNELGYHLSDVEVLSITENDIEYELSDDEMAELIEHIIDTDENYISDYYS